MKTFMLVACFSVLSFVSACTFSGEVIPDLECTKTCDQDKQDCVTTCKQACIDASGGTDGGDPDVACDTDCDTTCTKTYDECTVTCTDAK